MISGTREEREEILVHDEINSQYSSGSASRDYNTASSWNKLSVILSW